MRSYRVFGGVLESELEFPELELAVGELPDWTLRASEPIAGAEQGVLLGEDRVDVGVMVRSYRMDTGFRLAYEDTGVFDISADGREIWWRRPASADLEAVRLDVLGRVLALALHAASWLSLHGSAVALEAGAVAFLAPKGNGKSTLAFALMRAGAPLMTDDTVVIDPGPPPMVRPGVQSVRLFRDSADWLSAPEPVAGSSDIKATFAQLATDARHTSRAPLAALYLLESVAAGTIAEPVERQAIAGPQCVFGLLAQTKIGTLLGGPEAATVFDAVVAVAESTPVYRLRVTRDYDKLGAVVEQIMAWHAANVAIAPTMQSAST
ncbi:MAG: hypothetical protein ABIP93_16790 [Gemmatimonadaceae bacterium]